jgi:hypothetical protein
MPHTKRLQVFNRQHPFGWDSKDPLASLHYKGLAIRGVLHNRKLPFISNRQNDFYWPTHRCS